MTVPSDSGPIIQGPTLLPAAGAFSDPSYVAFDGSATGLSPTTKRVTFMVTYVAQGDATSPQARFRVQWDMGATAGDDFIEAFTDATVITAIDTVYGRMTNYLLEWATPVITAGATYKFRLGTLEVPNGAKGVRVLAAELGDTNDQGTVTIAFTGADDV